MYVCKKLNTLMQAESLTQKSFKQNVRRYAPRQGSQPLQARQGRPAHFRHKKATFSQKVTLLRVLVLVLVLEYIYIITDNGLPWC